MTKDKLLEMVEAAGFPYSPDTLSNLEKFEMLVRLERGYCINACQEYMEDDGDGQHIGWYAAIDGCIENIRKRNKI